MQYSRIYRNSNIPGAVSADPLDSEFVGITHSCGCCSDHEGISPEIAVEEMELAISDMRKRIAFYEECIASVKARK